MTSNTSCQPDGEVNPKSPEDDQVTEVLAEKKRPRRNTVREWLPETLGGTKKGLKTKEDEVVAGHLSLPKRSASDRWVKSKGKAKEKAKEMKKMLNFSPPRPEKRYSDPLEQWMYDNSGGTLREKGCSYRASI